MKRRMRAAAVLALAPVVPALAVAAPTTTAKAPATKSARVASVEYVGMPHPATPDEKTSVYSGAQVLITYRDGRKVTVPLKYHQLMVTGDKLRGETVGGLYDHADQPINDANGQIASDAPDGTSLMSVPGLKPTNPRRNALALVTQYEYRETPPAGQTGGFWSKLPATMSMTLVNQSKVNGRLVPVKYTPVSFGDVAGFKGLWIPCAASLSPWNTHLSSEEYEPDAKTRQGLPKAKDSDDTTDIDSFSKYFFGDPKAANAYNYGLVPEVRVLPDGKTKVRMHYAMGRIARELVEVMPDNRTAYMGDDGKNTGLFMFVADAPGNMSAGTLYAAKWSQITPDAGGWANLRWIRLGHATDGQIKATVDAGIKFTDMWDVSLTDPKDKSFKKVVTYTGTEWLRLKPGADTAAAFLETRRYAAYLGATTEFTKMEGITHDTIGNGDVKGHAYVVISRVERSMRAESGAPADDIKLPENLGGAVYQMDLHANVADTTGASITSGYAATGMTAVPELNGGWFGRNAAGAENRDPEGNRCDQDKLCGPDNIKFSPSTDTMFIGEDTDRRNNNYVWAFNVKTRKLSRVLSVPRAAEATGLSVVENANGFAYITAGFQHPGEMSQNGNPGDDVLWPLLQQKWAPDLHRAAVGYIGGPNGGLPAIGPAFVPWSAKAPVPTKKATR